MSIAKAITAIDRLTPEDTDDVARHVIDCLNQEQAYSLIREWAEQGDGIEELIAAAENWLK